MKWLTLGRVVSAGMVHFRRNVWLSLASTAVMMLTLATLALLLLVTVTGQALLKTIESKVDITIFMADTATDTAILEVKADLEGRDDVASVMYITREQSLASFRERHRGNPRIAQTLKEVGNPLQPALVVRAVRPENYAVINAALESPKYQSYIASVTYDDSRNVIARLTSLIRTIRHVGVGITVTLGIIAVLVTYTTIRLAIYGYHEEIEIMHLVGASPWFIKGPFVIEGMLSGSIAALCTIAFLYPLLRILSPGVDKFLGGTLDLSAWATGHAPMILTLVGGVGVVLGTTSSIIAVQRYLRSS